MQSSISAEAPAIADGHDDANKRRLFLICVTALVTTSMTFILRAGLGSDLQNSYFDAIDRAAAGGMFGQVLGAVFLAFAFTLLLGSPLIDAVGMRNVLLICAGSFIVGSVLVIMADKISSGPGMYWVVWIGMLFTGIGWGCSEAVINPLTTTLYPDDKTHKLNVLHAWWPGGIILGGVLGEITRGAHLSWRVRFALVMIPALTLLVLLAGAKFPKTERAAAGIPAKDMLMAVLKPGFFVWFGAMLLTSTAELAPGNWVDFTLTRTIGMQGIWLIIYVSGLMFVMRHFAGTMVHKLSSVGLLWVSSLLAAIGLVLLSTADSPVLAFLAATVWGTGVCYMWPTMLAAASERYPKGGAFAMGMIGSAGSLAIYFALPWMGGRYDATVATLVGGVAKLKALPADSTQVLQAKAAAAVESFRFVAVLPAALLLVFGAIWLFDRSKGGFKPEKL
ncbi:MAG TPA: MFS transporter [Polyangiaceae bacterium]|nr:MFS transporter [Polyangiaceae bacterium]